MVEIDKHDFAITNTKKGGGSKKMVASGKKKNKNDRLALGERGKE